MIEIAKFEILQPKNRRRHSEKQNAVIISRNPGDRTQSVFGDNIVDNVRH